MHEEEIKNENKSIYIGLALAEREATKEDGCYSAVSHLTNSIERLMILLEYDKKLNDQDCANISAHY